MPVVEAELALRSVLDLLSDDAAGFDSALPPSFDVLFGDVLFGDLSCDELSFVAAADSLVADSLEAGSFAPDSALAAFFRASDG